MNTIQDLYQQAQLAEAAYANLAGMNVSTTAQVIKDALTDPDRITVSIESRCQVLSFAFL